MTAVSAAQSPLRIVPGQSYEKKPAGSQFDFASDDWFLSEYASKSNRFVKTIHIGFSAIRLPAVKLLVKQYAAWRLGRVKPVTVRTELNSRIFLWIQYVEYRKINDPSRFDARCMQLFLLWLQKKGVCMAAAQRIVRTVALLIETGQRLGWQVTEEPEAAHFLGMSMYPLRGKNAGTAVAGAHSAGGKEKSCHRYAKPIPDEIYRRIVIHAICDETDIITKAGILIQSQTGLRISEVLSLRDGCLRPDENDGFLLGYELKKTQKAEPVTRYIPANALVCNTVAELARATAHLRQQSGRTELFLVKNHGIRPASEANWNRGRLQSFLKRWEITEEGGVYPLHSHQFRASYVRRKLLAGVGIETLRQQLGHVSSEMTAQYVHIEPDELAEFLTACIGRRGGDGVD